jgi:hypothetical protein
MRIDEFKATKSAGENAMEKRPARWLIKVLQVLFSGYGVGIGVAFIFIAALLHEHLIVSMILFGIGPSFIVFGLFEIAHQHFLRAIYLDDSLSATKKAITELLCPYSHFISLGIRDVYSSLPSGKLRKFLVRSNTIRILKTWFPYDVRLVKVLGKALLKGASLELWLCDPDSKIMRYRCLAAGSDPNEGLARNLEAVKMVLNWISQGISGRVSIYFYDAWPGSPVIECDGGIFEGSYLRGVTSPLGLWSRVARDSEHGKSLLAQFAFNDDEITARLTTEQAMRRWYDKHSPHRPSKGEAEAA